MPASAGLQRGASARPQQRGESALGSIREKDPDWRKNFHEKADELRIEEDADPEELPIDSVITSPSPKHKKKVKTHQVPQAYADLSHTTVELR